MATNKDSLNGTTSTKPESNPNPNPNPKTTPEPTSEAAEAAGAGVVVGDAADVAEPVQPRNSSRIPFTNLSQVDADLALARTLQEQERAYMMLRMGGGYGGGVSDYGSDDDWETDDGENHEHDGDEDGENDVGDDEKDAFDVNAHGGEDGDEYETEEEEGGHGEGTMEIDATAFSNDEAFAMALQEEEERELTRRMMALAGIQIQNWQPVDHIVSDDEDEDDDEDDNDGQELWQEVDPDELSYEELVALGDVVGTQSRGLSANTIASLPSEKYKAPEGKDDNTETCVICRLDFEDGEDLTVLLCKHSYHPECINNWLQINKVCPVCNAEVS